MKTEDFYQRNDSHRIQMFADNTMFYITGNSVDEINESLKTNIRYMEKWLVFKKTELKQIKIYDNFKSASVL